jgi:hypothetical protein
MHLSITNLQLQMRTIDFNLPHNFAQLNNHNNSLGRHGYLHEIFAPSLLVGSCGNMMRERICGFPKKILLGYDFNAIGLRVHADTLCFKWHKYDELTSWP